MESIDLVVIGGGASGFMGAITAAESSHSSVLILEGSKEVLQKVRISGGGRCNVTNACWDPNELVINYPRGQKPLLGTFSRFSTGDAMAWFADKGLKLIIEEDGRIFPKSNSSQEVINCLLNTAKSLGIKHYKGATVASVDNLNSEAFKITCKNGLLFSAKKVLIATGNSPSGRKIAYDLGHKIIKAVPSLFTLKLNASWLTACSGCSVDNVALKLLSKGKIFNERGRILITHWGISGPATLKLSAFAARNLNEDKYKSSLKIQWSDFKESEARHIFKEYRKDYAVKHIRNHYPFKNIPKRLWNAMLARAEIKENYQWSNLSKEQENILSKIITNDLHIIEGKGPYGEEFVTAGGVSLDEVNMNSMESKIKKGIFFSGEILNIDGVTGGFNFQHCWTSGWLAGSAISQDLIQTRV